MPYPASYDNIPAVSTSQLIQSSFVNSQSNAINATQQTLGLNPQGGSVTVVARLNAMQTAIQQNGYNYAADTGTANNYAVTLSPTPTLVAGMAITFLATHTNTGASTLTVNGGSAISIKKGGNVALAGNDIVANQW